MYVYLFVVSFMRVVYVVYHECVSGKGCPLSGVLTVPVAGCYNPSLLWMGIRPGGAVIVPLFL